MLPMWLQTALGAARRGGSQTHLVRIIPVRVHKPRRSMLRILRTAALGFVSFGVYKYIVIDNLVVVLERELTLLSPEDRLRLQKEAETSDPWWIPLPFSIREVPHKPDEVFWPARSPEGNRFRELETEPATQQYMFRILKQNIIKAIKSQPALVAITGSDPQISASILDYAIPWRKPPSYVQAGFLVGDTNVIATTRPVSHGAMMMTKQALIPTCLLKSVWAFTSQLVYTHTPSVANALGIKPLFRNKTPRRTIQPSSQTLPSSSSTATTSESGTPDPHPLSVILNSVRDRDEESPGALARFHMTVAPISNALLSTARGLRQSLGDFTHDARLAFRIAWRQNTVSTVDTSGCVPIAGTVNVVGKRGWVSLNVLGHWDTEKKEFREVRMHTRGQGRLPVRANAAVGDLVKKSS